MVTSTEVRRRTKYWKQFTPDPNNIMYHAAKEGINVSNLLEDEQRENNEDEVERKRRKRNEDSRSSKEEETTAKEEKKPRKSQALTTCREEDVEDLSVEQ